MKTYVTYLKLTKTVERNLLLVDSYEKRLSGRTETTEESGSKKKAKPDDLVRVYETLIQNVTEISELKADDPEQAKEIAARILSFKATRCFYMALSYSYGSKWNEALALFDRAASQMKVAIEHYDSCKNVSQDTIKKLQESESKIRGHKAEAHAKGFLETIKAVTETPKEDPDNNAAVVSNRSLLNGLNKFDYSFAKNKQLIAFPPDFEPIKCKPLLLDIAFSECTFPNLEARKQSKSGSGFWRLLGYKQ